MPGGWKDDELQIGNSLSLYLTRMNRNRKGLTQRRQDLIIVLPLRALRLCAKIFIKNTKTLHLVV